MNGRAILPKGATVLSVVRPRGERQSSRAKERRHHSPLSVDNRQRQRVKSEGGTGPGRNLRSFFAFRENSSWKSWVRGVIPTI